VRAKRSLREAGVAFELPRGAALGERLASVLEVVYLIFNEGYTATHGSDWMRLGRMLAELAPDQAEVHGLLALMAIQAARTPARTNAQGQPILLADQDRARWDPWLIRLGLSALAHAESLGHAPGSYRLQAEIAACHARAARTQDTDWPRIAPLYALLMDAAPSPVVALNRAVAVGMAEGPAAGLALVEALLQDAALQRYPWLPAVQGDLLDKLGRRQEARQAFLRAADLAGNEREQALMIQRAQG
jgi:predicted RNA polymerase sigma factor